jgi:hypothetical protein
VAAGQIAADRVGAEATAHQLSRPRAKNGNGSNDVARWGLPISPSLLGLTDKKLWGERIFCNLVGRRFSDDLRPFVRLGTRGAAPYRECARPIVLDGPAAHGCGVCLCNFDDLRFLAGPSDAALLILLAAVKMPVGNLGPLILSLALLMCSATLLVFSRHLEALGSVGGLALAAELELRGTVGGGVVGDEAAAAAGVAVHGQHCQLGAFRRQDDECRELEIQLLLLSNDGGGTYLRFSQEGAHALPLTKCGGRLFG